MRPMTKNDTMRRSTALAAAAVCVLLLAGCGNSHKKGATQSVARVDGTELTMTELKYRLNREHVRPDRVHVLQAGKITRSGDIDLARELESTGYAEAAA